jgi:drug/metabolite transporter (DMT)-like permease
MTTDWLGQVCALLAALTWAFALVFFKLSGERISPLALNLFKNTIGLVLLGATLLAMGDGVASLREFPIADIHILIISGFIGIALADTVMFHSLNLVGVSLFAIVDCAYSPIVLLISWLLIAEQLTAAHYLGGGLVLVGIMLSSRHPPPPGRTRRQIASGALLGVLAIALMAIGIVMAKPVLDADGFPLVWGTIIRLAAGTAALAVMAAASPQRRKLYAVFRPSAIWKYSVPGSILGGFLSMVFWVAGFKYTQAAIAAILNQTSVIFATILAVVLLKEGMTRRKFAAVALAVTGVVLVAFDPF